MSLPNRTSPPAGALLNINEQVFSVDSAIVMPHNGTFPLLEAPVLSSINGTNQHHGQEATPIIEQNVHFGPTVSQENGQVNPNVQQSSRAKQRREPKSKVWDDFTKYEGEDGKEWALCKHCKKNFVGSSKSGTTHLKNHLERCQRKRDPGGCSDHKSIEASDSLNNLVVSKEKSKVNQELNNLDGIRVIIKYWGSSLEPIKDDILKVYLEEREKLRKYLAALPCRFNVTIECHETRDEVDVWFIVLHFIDDSWELKKRIIQFFPNLDMEFNLGVISSEVLVWKIDRSILCIAYCSSYSLNDKVILFNEWLSIHSSLPHTGINCLLIGWLAEDLRTESHLKASIRKHVENLLNHVRCLLGHPFHFQIAVEKAKSTDKKLQFQAIEPPNYWTYLDFELLEFAIRFKIVFSIMEQEGISFDDSINLWQEWHKGTMLYECLTALNDAGRSLSENASKYATANVYFPIICDIFLKLLQWEKSEYDCIREIASSVREEFFDKYWTKSNLVLVITAVLDPRFKMDIVQRWYKEIYGADANRELKKISNYVTKVYNEYAKGPNNSRSSTRDHGDGYSSTPFKMLDAMGRPCTSSQHVNDVALPESELDRYLQDCRLPAVEEFDILAWWRSKSSTYPTLARIARDFLSLPISAPPSLDSSLAETLDFIFGSEELDDSLKQALACTKAWWRSL